MSAWWPLILWMTMGAGLVAGLVVEAIDRDEYAFDNKFEMVLMPICILFIWPLPLITTLCEKCKIAARNRRNRVYTYQREAALRTIGDEISEYDFHYRPNYRERRRAERSQGPW